MLWLLITTGIRHRELSTLETSDLDWRGAQVRVVHGKGQKERQIPFERQTQRAMLKYLHLRKDGQDRLWVTEEQTPMSYRAIAKDMVSLKSRAGVVIKDTMHVFRRTFAANAVRQGFPRPYVQGIMGHSTPTMMDVYTAAMQGENGATDVFRDFDPWG
jgi:integrase/recombinase XerC